MGMASEAYNKTGNHAKALEYAEEGYKVDSIGGRKKRMGRNEGYTSDWKKAIVTLAEGSKTIEFFDGMI